MVTTERAKHFYSPQDIPVTLYSDADEWEVSAGGPRGEFHVFLPTGQEGPPAAMVLVAGANRPSSSQLSRPLGQRR